MPAEYAAAKASCARQGGALAFPVSKEENTQLKELLLSKGVVDRMWLGGSDFGHDGVWSRVQANGGDVELSYTNWAKGQPDGSTKEDCLEIWTSGLWNDAPCEHEKAYACSVPQPPHDLTFPCSDGMLAKMATANQRTTPPPKCKYVAFGADGWEESTLKQEYAECQVLCTQLGAQVAEPRTAEQLQYLARILRDSSDDSMWIGLGPVASVGHGAGDSGWKWRGSGDNLTARASSWAPGQPGKVGHCVSLWADGTWNARACGGDTRASKVCPCEQRVL